MMFTIYLAFLGFALLMFSLAFIPESNGILMIGVITAGAIVANLSFTSGFAIVFSDMSGPFTGVVFSMSNAMANTAGIIAPMAVSYLAPNVRKIVHRRKKNFS